MNKPTLFAVVALIGLADPTQAADVLKPSRAVMPGAAPASLSGQTVPLGLADAVFLGVRDNRAIRSALIQRVAQKFDLRVAEDRFAPQLAVTGRSVAGRNQDDRYLSSQAGPAATLQSEWGARFSLSWTGQRDDKTPGHSSQSGETTFSVVQPLLRDAGPEAATASLRLARLDEQVNKLALKAEVSQTVTQIVLAYRELLRAQENLRLAQEALARSHQLMEVNKALIAAGRMAAFEIVQTEADAATQELSVEEAVNRLDAGRRGLLQLLALDLNTPLHASDALAAEAVNINPQQALAMALEHQPEHLMLLIADKQAAINLSSAQNQRLWDVSLVGGASHRLARSPGAPISPSERRWDGYAGLQLQIPLGDLHARQKEVQAKVAVEDSAIRLADSRQKMERDVIDAVHTVETRWRQYEIARRARDLSLKKLEIERDKLKAGRSSNFQVLSFEADLRHAENRQLDAVIAYLNAQTLLDETLGMTLEHWDIALND